MKNFFWQRRIGLCIAGIWFGLDILSKQAALAIISGPAVTVIPGFFNLRLAFNRGVSYSFLADVPSVYLPYGLAIIAVIASGFFLYYMSKGTTFWHLFGMASLLGGAMGNMIDRLQYGAVVDFLDFYYGHWHFYTFNIADTAISLGVAALILDAALEYRKEKRDKKSCA